MHDKKYVIGVDCGNSKTHYALVDSEGNLMNFLQRGTSSHENLSDGFPGMKRELDKQFTSLLNNNGLNYSDIDFIVLGMAGIDRKIQHQHACEIISELGFKKFIVSNDAYLGIKAGSMNKYGVCSINGAGTCCVAIDPYNNSIQLGGLGSTFGDDAGALHMGAMVIRRTYEYCFRNGISTIMTELLFEELGIVDENDLVDAVYEKVFSRQIQLGILSKIIFIAANQGDKAAIELLRETGINLAQAVLGAINKLDYSSVDAIDIILAGSVYIKGEHPALLDAFKNEVIKHVKAKVNFILLNIPPVTGAILWALENVYGELPGQIRDIVIKNISHMKQTKEFE